MEGTLPNDRGSMSEAARAARAARADRMAERQIEVAVALGELVEIVDPASGEKWYTATRKGTDLLLSLGLGGLPEQRVPAEVYSGAEAAVDAKEIAIQPPVSPQSVSTRATHARKRSGTGRYLLAGALAVIAVPTAVITAAGAGSIVHPGQDANKTGPVSSGEPSAHGTDSSPQPMEGGVSEIDDSQKVKPSARSTTPVQPKPTTSPEAKSTMRPQSAPTGRRRKGEPETYHGGVYKHRGEWGSGGRHRGQAARERQEVTIPGLQEGARTVTRFIGDAADNLGSRH